MLIQSCSKQDCFELRMFQTQRYQKSTLKKNWMSVVKFETKENCPVFLTHLLAILWRKVIRN